MNNDKFRANIAKRVDRAKGRTQLFYKRLTIELLRRIVLKSPVDTGRFRANWNTSYRTPDRSTHEGTDKSGALSIAAGEKELGKISVDGGIIYVTNSLPYARVLEFGLYGRGQGATVKTTRDGYSVQAPEGMVRVTLAELKGITRDIVSQVKK